MQQPAAPPARPPPPPPGSSTPAAGGGAYYGDKDDHGGRMHVSQYPGANALPQGLILPLFPRPAALPALSLGRAPFACLQCGALANPFCRVEAKGAGEEWTCAFCAAVNVGRFDRGARGGGGKLPPEFERQAVEFRAPLPGRRRRGRTLSSSMGMMGAGGGGSGLDASLSSSVGGGGAGGGGGEGKGAAAGGSKSPPPGLVLVIDRNASTRKEALALLDAIEATLMDPRLDPLTPVSLLLFGGAVTLYRVGQFGGEVKLPFVLRAHQLDAAVSGANSDKLTTRFQRGEYWVPLHAGRGHLLLALQNMLTDGTFRFTAEDENTPDRFLGTAVDCLNQCYPPGRRARVCVFLTGAPWGPGDERREEEGAATLPTDVLRPQERRRYWAGLSRGARHRGLALDVFCLGIAAHLDAPSLHLLVAETGGAVLLYASAQDPELRLDLAKVLFQQPLPCPPDQPATLEIRISSHMEIARLLLPPDAVLLHATAHTTTTTLDAGGTHSSEPARGRSRTQSTYYAVDGGEWEEGAGATGRALVSGGRAVVSGVASALGGLASAVGSWLTARGPLLAEGEEFDDGDVGGPGASLKEGWALLHASEAVQGKPLTPPRHPYWGGVRRLLLPRLPLVSTSNKEDAEERDLGLLYRPRDTVLGIWGARPDEFVVQSVLRYAEPPGARADPGGTSVTRVVTEKFHSKMTTREHVPLAVLAVKRAVADILQRAPAGGDTGAAAAEARAGLEAAVTEIRALYPSKQHFTRTKDGFGKPCSTEFEEELLRLYQAHRGPLLGFHMQGEDTRYTLRHRFLAAGTQSALRLLSPTCLSVGPLGTPGNNSPSLTQPDAATLPRLRPWPCQTMGLWSNVILVMDMQDRIVIWIGREAAYMLWSASAASSDGQALDAATAAYAAHQHEAERALAACRAYAARAREARFPTPQVLEVQEDDPLERFVMARVIPSHKDPREEMLASVPRLRDLPPEGLEALRLRFASLSTDEPSLQQFLRKHAPSQAKPPPNPYYSPPPPGPGPGQR